MCQVVNIKQPQRLRSGLVVTVARQRLQSVAQLPPTWLCSAPLLLRLVCQCDSAIQCQQRAAACYSVAATNDGHELPPSQSSVWP